MAHSLSLKNYMRFGEQEIETAKEIGGYLGGAGVFGVAMRFLWKILNKYATGADTISAKNNAEEALWKRLQDQIEELQASELAMETKIELLRTELMEVKQENARLRTENQFYKQTIDEQVEIIASLEAMMSNVKITDKGKHE